jgi:hypothetical protein
MLDHQNIDYWKESSRVKISIKSWFFTISFFTVVFMYGTYFSSSFQYFIFLERISLKLSVTCIIKDLERLTLYIFIKNVDVI